MFNLANSASSSTSSRSNCNQKRQQQPTVSERIGSNHNSNGRGNTNNLSAQNNLTRLFNNGNRLFTAFQVGRTTQNSIRTLLQSLVYSLGGPVLLFYYLISMSMFYQVMGAPNRCPKIKKHPGIKLRSANPSNPKAKEPYMPNDVLIYSCESEEYTLTIKCLDDFRWSETPYCKDPTNFTCPDLGPVDNGYHNATKPPYKVGTVVEFRCQNEPAPKWATPLNSSSTLTTLQPVATTLTPTLLTTLGDPTNTNNQTSISGNLDIQQPTRYNLAGPRYLRCLPSAKWNHPVPGCSPVVPEPESNVGLLLTSAVLILVPILILAAIAQLFIRWRKRQEQRERWKQYFTDYKYRHSKTSIAFGRPQTTASNTTTIPVTDL